MTNKTRPTLAELMKSVNSTKWPERWEAMYDRVMDDYEKNGCALADPAHYDRLNEKYKMFPTLIDDYKTAASELAKDDALCRFVMLVCEAMKDRQNISADITSLEMPHTENGEYCVKYDMLTALIMASAAEYQHSLYVSRGLPQEHIDYGMKHCEEMVRSYKVRHGGNLGAMSWGWYQLTIDAKLYRIGRLEIELETKFTSKATVFENESGEVIALAHGIKVHKDGFLLGAAGYTDEEGSWEPTLTEDETHYIGYAYGYRGTVGKDEIRLDKKKWKKTIEPGAPVIGLHIPPGGGMTPEAIDSCFAQSKEFLAKYFPEYDYKGFVCGSWLMDDKLCDLLGEDANISKFCNRFYSIGSKSSARGVFHFVFMRADVKNVDYATLPENTSLERKLKQLYINGDVIYENLGFIPRSKI